MNSTLDTVRDVVTAVLMLPGATLCLLGGLGLLRFPDTLSRLHAVAKAQTAGLVLVLVGVALQLSVGYALMLMLVILFQLLTVPVLGQIVGRAAYRTAAAHRTVEVADELGERLTRERGAARDAGTEDADVEEDPDADR